MNLLKQKRMEKYNEFMRFKKYNKAKQCLKIDAVYFYESIYACDEAVHTLEIILPDNIYSYRINVGMHGELKIIEFLSTKIKFIRRLVINGFSGIIYNNLYGHPKYYNFIKTVFIKNIIFNYDYYGYDINLLKTIGNIPNIKLPIKPHSPGNIQNIENIKCININGLGDHTTLCDKHYRKQINDILDRVANNRKEYNTHMTSIRYVYLARHSGLFALLPTNIIDYIISKIYRF